MFTKFNPTEEKVKALSKKLMEEPLYLSDEFRDYELIHKMLFNGFSNKENIYYEMGNFGGLLGFVNIVSNHKADMVFKIWDKEIWGLRFAKELKALIKETMEKYDLRRMVTESADTKVVKFAKILGWKIEGRFKYGFKWDNEFYTLHRIRIIREEVI